MCEWRYAHKPEKPKPPLTKAFFSKGTAWSIALFAIIGIYIIAYLVLTYLLWRVKKDKTRGGYLELLFEWPVIRTGAIAITFLLVTNAIIWAVKQFYDVNDTVKIVTRFLLTLTVRKSPSFLQTTDYYFFFVRRRSCRFVSSSLCQLQCLFSI